MKKFWEWMDKKGYGYIGQFEHRFIWYRLKSDLETETLEVKNQMLIGYMIEYLLQHKDIDWQFGIGEGYKVDESIEKIYSDLVKVIEEVDK